MQTSAINVSTTINELTLFDQAVSASAANMKATFDMQIAGISQTFAATFQAIDATIATSAANCNLSFGTSALLLTEQFNLAFMTLDATALNSSLILSTNYLAALTLISAGLTALEEAFPSLFEKKEQQDWWVMKQRVEEFRISQNITN